MGMMRALSGLTALAFIAGCSSAYDPYLKTGSNDHYSHEIEVVEDTAILEVAMSEAEPGIPYFERRRVEAFLSDYKSRGYRHGPLILSVPMNSPWGPKLETSVQETLSLADEYAVMDIARSDYDSNGSPDAPMVLAFKAYKAIPPKCASMASVNFADTRENDTLPTFGCAQQVNLAALVADPADLRAAQPEDPSDVMRRVTVIDKYRAGESTITERSDAESGAIAQAIE